MKKNIIILVCVLVFVSSCHNTSKKSVSSQDSIHSRWNMFENINQAYQKPQHMDCTLLGITIGENTNQAISKWKEKGWPLSIDYDLFNVKILKKLIFEGVELEHCSFNFDDCNEIILIVLRSKKYKDKNEATKDYENLKNIFKDLMSTYDFVKSEEDSEIDPPDALFPILKDIYFRDECDHTISIDMRCQKKELEAAQYDNSYTRDWWYLTIQMYTYNDPVTR